MTTKNPAAVALGSIKSPAKAVSSAANGRKGGRPTRLYDSGPMSVGGKRGRIIVDETEASYKVSLDSLYEDEPKRALWYKKEDVPAWSGNIETWWWEVKCTATPYSLRNCAWSRGWLRGALSLRLKVLE